MGGPFLEGRGHPWGALGAPVGGWEAAPGPSGTWKKSATLEFAFPSAPAERELVFRSEDSHGLVTGGPHPGARRQEQEQTCGSPGFCSLGSRERGWVLPAAGPAPAGRGQHPGSAHATRQRPRLTTRTSPEFALWAAAPHPHLLCNVRCFWAHVHGPEFYRQESRGCGRDGCRLGHVTPSASAARPQASRWRS